MRKLGNPMPYQGGSKNQKYFEGWYYKQVSEDGNAAVCFIPGISYSQDDAHCFVQYICSYIEESGRKAMATGYCQYPAADFHFRDEPFQLRVGDSCFSETEIMIDLTDGGSMIKGSFQLGPFTPIRKSFLMPNIMGYFAYFPKMECNHGVVSMRHPIRGALMINERKIDFDNGIGYIEKDWGTSFPERYIWLQCSNFKNSSVSIVFSAADIPFCSRKFFGFICNLTIDQREYRFATYNFSRLNLEHVSDREAALTLVNREANLRLEAYANDPGELASPRKGQMIGRIKEDPSGILKLRLTDRLGRIIFADSGSMAGIEIHNISSIQPFPLSL